jgi:hypothetical protein
VQAGGSLLAASILIGVLAGALLGQTSIGFLVGTGIGLLILAFMWLRDRNR